jgi:sugar-specific transcriptional regulator TrmB
LEPSFSEQQVLVDLGLTLKQARVYLALARSGPSKILAISKISNVTRPDVYAALEKLLEGGLVERIIKRPIEYKAIPLSKGLSLLLKVKTDQFERVRTETEFLRVTVRLEEIEHPDHSAENPQFVLVPKGKAVIDKIAASIENAQRSIDLVVSWKRFAHGVADTFIESVEKAWAKKVNIRFTVERPPKGKTAKQLIDFFRSKPCTQLRFADRQPNTVFGIYDKKEVFVIVYSKTDIQSSSALWSNDEALVSLASEHFEMLWHTSKENTD